MSIDKMIAQYKDMAELQQFAEAQQKTITQLIKKNKKLEEEVVQLKSQSTTVTPIKELSVLSGTTEEEISKMELEKLKMISLQRELTLEETRRVEIYSKILASFRKGNESIDAKSREMKDEELLALVEGSDG